MHSHTASEKEDSRTQVLVLRNVNEEQNLSMKLYADRLSAALAGRLAISSYRPWGPAANGRPRLATKALQYAARYGIYPLSVLHERADVFHIVDHGYAHLLAFLPPERTIVTCHDIMLLKLAAGELGKSIAPPRLATHLFRLSVRFLRRARAVVAVSQSTADDLARHLHIDGSRIHVIHPGVDASFRPPGTPKRRAEFRERLGLGDRPVLLHVGNNWFYKNLEGLLRALVIVRKQRPEALLVRVGKQLSARQRQLASELGVLPHIRELGHLDNEALQQAYWAADLLVFPSLWEGFGWPPLEAMASGTPVVCSHGGSLREVVGEAAEIVDPSDPCAIAAGVLRVLSDERRRTVLRSRGFARVQQFTWQRAADQMLQIYNEVTEANRARQLRVA
jgi:glycosyltransferase involved in cell wall biosynthesis